jgi:hypothetical protein
MVWARRGIAPEPRKTARGPVPRGEPHSAPPGALTRQRPNGCARRRIEPSGAREGRWGRVAQTDIARGPDVVRRHVAPCGDSEEGRRGGSPEGEPSACRQARSAVTARKDVAERGHRARLPTPNAVECGTRAMIPVRATLYRPNLRVHRSPGKQPRREEAVTFLRATSRTAFVCCEIRCNGGVGTLRSGLHRPGFPSVRLRSRS